MKKSCFIFKNPKLSILMPAYNEERTIEAIVKKIEKVDLESIGVKKELIIVDDGSKDRTVEIIRHLKKVVSLVKRLPPRVKYDYRQQKNPTGYR